MDPANEKEGFLWYNKKNAKQMDVIVSVFEGSMQVSRVGLKTLLHMSENSLTLKQHP